jgi:uncharacterized damage-inducible protein DinB
MDAATVSETLRQVIEGMDFAPAKRLVNIKADLACAMKEGFPYSIATNIWHCDYWNRLWLARLRGEKRPAKNVWAEDWHEPAAEDWPEVKASFLENLTAAHEIASAKPFTHAMKSDDDAIQVLNQIAVHTAYHVGQVALLKRMLKQKTD